jgi:hypothetical protein
MVVPAVDSHVGMGRYPTMTPWRQRQRDVGCESHPADLIQIKERCGALFIVASAG